MNAGRGSRRNVILAIVVIALVVVAAWGLWFARSVNMLPWQPEPTRIAITPFADLPGGAGVATPSP